MNNVARLQTAREMVSHLEAGDEARADELFDAMARSREHSLFMEVGRLTRELHDALKNFSVDGRITGLATTEIPDAKQRLNYVMQKTEEAANRTLGAVEKLLPLSEQIGETAEQCSADLARFTRREMSVEEFKALCERLAQFLDRVKSDSGTMRNTLSEVLMAQDFQDLTGQVIRRVISLVTEVEDNLVRLVRFAGANVGAMRPEEPTEAPAQVSPIRPEGPQVRGTTDSPRVNGQDEVDDLLSSLGF
jgi:chemotaxis protein CheZ